MKPNSGDRQSVKHMQSGFVEPEHALEAIIGHLKERQRCHTALLYGSRARGDATATSDYDVVGIRDRGAKTRVAGKRGGAWWDVFVYPAKDLKKLGDEQLGWKDAQVLFERGKEGRALVRRLQAHAKRRFKPAPPFEIEVSRAWSLKQLERCKAGDVHALYRRAELQTAAVEHYFQIRRKRFWGPKAGLRWIEANDPPTFRLFKRVYSKPADLRALRALVKRVYRV